ncbi:MAG TPA: hypothetical protein VFT46_07140 [Holophagaceae bacterium]|nr:hypothetical protein [Holophagaceae bacterium]
METLILNGSEASRALKRLSALARKAKGRSKALIQDAYRALGGRSTHSPARGRSAQENPMSKKKKATARKTVAKKHNPTTHHHTAKKTTKRRHNPTFAGLNLGSFLVDAGAVVAGGVAHSFVKKQAGNFLPSLGSTTASALAGALVAGGALYASRKSSKYRGHLENFAAGAAASAVKDIVSHFAPGLFAGLGDATPASANGYFDPETGQWVPFDQLHGTYGDDPAALAAGMAGAYFEQSEAEPVLVDAYN